MITMKKLLDAIERYFEIIAAARVYAVPMNLDRDPWNLTTVPTRRHASLAPDASSAERTTMVQDECTVAGQTAATNDAANEIDPPRSVA